jgi:hypothetical protein
MNIPPYGMCPEGLGESSSPRGRQVGNGGLGTWLAPGGDVNEDGVADILVNSWVGSVYLFMGTANGPGPGTAVVNAGVPDQLFGQTVY